MSLAARIMTRPVRALTVGAALAVSMIPGIVQAQSRALQTLWIVQPAAAPPGERELAGGDFVVRQRLLPSGLAELRSPLILGRETLAAGTQLVEVTTSDAKVFCAVGDQGSAISLFRKCLVDADADGAFEGWFSGLSQSKALPTIGGNRPKTARPLSPVAYAMVPPSTMRDVYFVAIERRNFFNIYSRESFQIAFGSNARLDRLTTPDSFKSTEMPKSMTIMGARFTALSESAGKMRIRVDTAMPRQPFGIVKTTTVRFY